MAIAYHGSAALFNRFDPSHLLEGDGKFKFGVGAYLTSSYATAAHYSGVSGSLDKYVYTVEIPDMTEDNYLHSLRPVHPSIIAKAEAKLGVSIPEEACQRGKFFRKFIGNTLIGFGNTIKRKTGSASLEAEKAASASIWNAHPWPLWHIFAGKTCCNSFMLPTIWLLHSGTNGV